MKIVVIGGHMAPALSFIEALPKDVSVLYIGRKHAFEGDNGTSLEYQTIHKNGIPFIPFTTGRVQRVLTPRTIPSLFKLPKGFFSAFQILTKERPDVVVGFGGYMSVPLGIVASLLGIPLVIHEQTLQAGLANKILARFATKICLSWDSARQYFPKEKIVMTGNPTLPFDDSKLSTVQFPKSNEKLPLIFIAGGSGGSHAINSYILHILPDLLEHYQVLHQTGDAKEFGDFEKLQEKVARLPQNLRDRYSIVRYIQPEAINAVYKAADMVIARSGINTVIALLLLKKKSILIPIVVGQKNEQLHNAQLLERAGIGRVLKQNTLTAEKLLATIREYSGVKIKEEKGHVQVYSNGADNLVHEVLRCTLPPKQREK